MKDKKKRQVKNGITFNGKNYSYVLRVPDPQTGKTKPLWVGGFNSYKEAQLARDKARVSLANGNYTPPSKISVGEYFEAWLLTKRIGVKAMARARSNTKNYIIPKLGHIKLRDLKPFHIQAFFTELSTGVGVRGNPLAQRSINYIKQVLNECLNYAVDVDNLLSVNPARLIKLPEAVSKTPRPYTTTELNQFLNVAKAHRLYFFFRLSAYTGARRGELCALRWSDFDGSGIYVGRSRVTTPEGVIELHKTKAGKNHRRRIPLDSQTINELQAHKERQNLERLYLGSEIWQDTGYIFTQENGLPIHPDTPSRIFTQLCAKSGLRHTRLHDIRHTHATELLRAGEPLHVVAHRLGHRDAMVTATIYAHVDTDQSVSASETFAKAMRNG